MERLPGLELTSWNSKLHPSYLDLWLVFWEKGITIHTAHARVRHGTRYAAHPNLSDNVPHTCPCARNPELWQTVPFSTRYVWAKNTDIRKSREYKTTPHRESRGIRIFHSRRKRKFERTPRAAHCKDRAQTSTTVSRRSSSVVFSFALARTARIQRGVSEKSTKNHKYKLLLSSH